MLKTIVLLAAPIILENLMQVTMGLADNYFVSRLGTAAIAGVGVTNLIMNIYLSLFFAVGVGTTALVSRHLGAGEQDKASEAAQQSMLLSIIIGLLVGAGSLIFCNPMLMLMGLDVSLIRTATPYFMTVLVPTVFLSMSIMISSALRGAKDTATTMKIALISNLINIILDPILIFGFMGIPGMGIVGAGIATSVSRLAGLALLMKKAGMADSRVRLNYRKTFKFDRRKMGSILRIGVPVATERLFMRFGQLVYYGFIIALGTEVYAAYVVSGTLDSFAYIPGIGIGGAAAALVGTSLGGGKKEEAYRYGMGSLFIGAVFMVVIGVGNFIFAPVVAEVFTRDPIVNENIVLIMRVMAFSQPLVAITLIITPALQGAGDTKVPMVYTLVGIWIFRVLGCYVLVHRMGYGIVAVVSTVFVDLIVRSILLIHRYKKREWQGIQID